MCAKNIDKEAKAAEKAAAKAAAQEAKAAKAKTKTKAKRKNVGANEFNFFFLHGEKIGIAAAVGIFGMMLAGGAGLEEFNLTPEQITDAANKAAKHIDESEVSPQEYDEALVNYDYGEYAKLAKSAVTVNAYETPNRWEQSLFPDKNKRPNVKPLPVENLRAVACVGAIMYKELTANNAATALGGAGGPGGAMTGGAMTGGAGGMMGATGGETKGRQWIAVTGSIPIRKQQAAYGDLFGNAQYLDDARDQPRYLYYELERGEVAPNGDVAWSKVDVLRAIKKENNQWNGVGSEQVGFSYHAPTFASYPPMAMSCPPMANKPFGEEIANLPNIPLNSSEQIEVQSAELERWNKLQEAMNQIDESTLLDRDPFEGASAMGGAGGMGGAMDSGMGGGMGPSGGMAASGGMGGAGGMGAGNDWLVNREAVAKQMLSAQTVASVDYYLFRYFDFEVEEGKTYQYRVKLLLANPNYGVEERFVEDPTATEQKIVASDFSEPSNPASLGRSARVFAQSVEAPARPGAEPRVRMASIYFEQESATESLASDLTMRLGQVANFKGKPHEAINVAGARMAGGMNGMGAMGMGAAAQSGGRGGRGGRGGGKATVDHVSDACLVDAIGGAKISGAELRSPGKVMILEPNGYLQIREVKEDARELGRYDGSQAGGMGLGTGAAGMMM